MPEPQQIIKINSLFSHCETYNCRKKVAYAIGRPDGPRELWSYFCEDCMKSIINSIPEELLPETTNDTREDYQAEKVYTCKYCGGTFATPGALGNHVRRCPRKGE